MLPPALHLWNGFRFSGNVHMCAFAWSALIWVNCDIVILNEVKITWACTGIQLRRNDIPCGSARFCGIRHGEKSALFATPATARDRRQVPILQTRACETLRQILPLHDRTAAQGRLIAFARKPVHRVINTTCTSSLAIRAETRARIA